MDSESSIDHETLYDDERPAGRRWYDSYTWKPEWISYGLLALLYVLILVLFITVYAGANVTRKDLVTLKEMNDFRERVHNLSSAMDDLHTSLKKKTCEDGWKQLDDSCYSSTVVKATWSQTRDSCLKKGADLASITSEREQLFLVSISGASSYKHCWIGLHDMDEEGTWTWVDGSNYETSYKRWGNEQPDDWEDAEDCVHLRAFGEWNDISCDYEGAYGICEKKL
ncbi:lactose-binding lectin l-2-like [Eleutherodactylus coqui]|uniref:lactose-binding lectin l-2-like n=1 Tax=Eleutherodactylus coqui TaxID=57060 RepID=UPI0034624379